MSTEEPTSEIRKRRRLRFYGIHFGWWWRRSYVFGFDSGYRVWETWPYDYRNWRWGTPDGWVSRRQATWGPGHCLDLAREHERKQKRSNSGPASSGAGSTHRVPGRRPRQKVTTEDQYELWRRGCHRPDRHVLDDHTTETCRASALMAEMEERTRRMEQAVKYEKRRARSERELRKREAEWRAGEPERRERKARLEKQDRIVQWVSGGCLVAGFLLMVGLILAGLLL